MFSIHGVNTCGEFQSVFQHLGGNERAQIQTVVERPTDDTLTAAIVDAGHVLRTLRPAIDRHVVVVADSRAQHFVLPVGVAAIVVAIFQAIGLHIIADVVGCGDVEFLGDVVECHISVVGNVGALCLSTTLGSDDNHTIGGFRTVNGGGGSIAQHINALDIIGSHHRDIHTGNTIDDIIGRHGSATQRGSTTQGDAGGAIGVASAGNNKTSHLALQHRGGVGEHTPVQVFGLHRGDGRGDVFAAHSAVAHHHHFVEECMVFLHLCVLTGVDAKVFISHIREVEFCPRSHVERVTSVDIGDSGILCSSLYHSNSDERFSVFVGDDARDVALCHRDGTA